MGKAINGLALAAYLDACQISMQNLASRIGVSAKSIERWTKKPIATMYANNYANLNSMFFGPKLVVGTRSQPSRNSMAESHKFISRI